MHQPIHIERHPQGPRVFVLGQRVHHASFAIVLAAVCMVHDRQDRRDWFRPGSQRTTTTEGA